jgi:integrase/recombinase XerD
MGFVESAGGERISPLRRRMIQDMELAGLMPGTRREYISAVVYLVEHCGGKHPELITEEEVYRYILWLRDERQVARGTFYARFAGLKYLFYRTLDRDWALFRKKRFARPSRSDYRLRFPGRNAVA